MALLGTDLSPASVRSSVGVFDRCCDAASPPRLVAATGGVKAGVCAFSIGSRYVVLRKQYCSMRQGGFEPFRRSLFRHDFNMFGADDAVALVEQVEVVDACSLRQAGRDAIGR